MNQAEDIDYQHPSFRDQVRFSLIILLLVSGICFGYWYGIPAYWLGWFSFAIAAFSVAGNDAVQTVGTFFESKKSVHWLKKLSVLGSFLVIVHFLGWALHGGEIHFGRLDNITETVHFNLLQLLAPVILVAITRLRAPISTTFLVLGLFGGSSVDKMLIKSFLGYGIAFFCAIFVWAILAKLDPGEYNEEHRPNPVTERKWSRLQWFSTIYLWIAWLLQDTANIAVFLPRKLELIEFATACGLILLALAIIFKTNGGTIQRLVSEKSDIKWAKAATILDIVYGSILFVFQYLSNVPMSTTWVFLGLLAGREIILNVSTSRDLPYLDTFRKVAKDVFLASLGLVVSLVFFYISSRVYP